MTFAGLIHMFLHLLVPLALAWVICGKDWRVPLYLMLATILVDIDHLLATPWYDAERCSINYHPLHRWPAWLFYGLLALAPVTKVRWIGIGLLVHMLLDASDCVRQQGFSAFITGIVPFS